MIYKAYLQQNMVVSLLFIFSIIDGPINRLIVLKWTKKHHEQEGVSEIMLFRYTSV